MTTTTKRRHRQRITVEFVMSHDPCWNDAEARVRALLGRGKTLLQCLDLPGVSNADKVWLATRKGACSERVQRLFAAACAERVLPLYEARFPDDERPRVAIQTAVRFALGLEAAEELESARHAAHAAANGTVITDAIYAAEAAFAAADAASADNAAFFAADFAADTAYAGAAYSRKDESMLAERAWQVETLRALLEDA